jgi:hypothetical protein
MQLSCLGWLMELLFAMLLVTVFCTQGRSELSAEFVSPQADTCVIVRDGTFLIRIKLNMRRDEMGLVGNGLHRGSSRLQGTSL